MDNRSLREAAARKAPAATRATPVHVSLREASANPLQDILDFENEARDSLADLRGDAPKAAKLLEKVIDQLGKLDRPLQAVNSDWKKAITAFKQFQGEVEDKDLERKFGEAVSSMWKALGFGQAKL